MTELINSSQRKIIWEIYEEPGINLSNIIKKTRLSPNYVSGYVNFLVKKGIVKEERIGRKKAHIRRFFFNFISSEARALFTLVEHENKEILFKKYPKLRTFFEQLQDIPGIDFILIYGSYARLAADKDSDIDILIVGKKINSRRIREIFVTLDIETSIKIEAYQAFEKNLAEKRPLYLGIMREHVLVFDKGKFIKLLKKSV